MAFAVSVERAGVAEHADMLGTDHPADFQKGGALATGRGGTNDLVNDLGGIDLRQALGQSMEFPGPEAQLPAGASAPKVPHPEQATIGYHIRDGFGLNPQDRTRDGDGDQHHFVLHCAEPELNARRIPVRRARDRRGGACDAQNTMASNLVGTATVFSMDNRTVAFSGVATTEAEFSSGGLSLTDSFDKVDLKGAGGRTIARGATNRVHQISVEILFKDVSVNATRATADAKTKLPAVFGLVTLAGFNNSLYDGDWNYEGGSIADTTDGFRKATLTLSRTEKADGTVGAMTAVPAA